MAEDFLGDPKIPETPAWWLARLENKLADRLTTDAYGRTGGLSRYSQYYDGVQRLAFASERFRRAFGKTFSAFGDNWCQLVVDATEERLDIEGFRIPVDDEEELTIGDQRAWDIWQANQMDAQSQVAHTEALINGMSYVLVGPGEAYPEITVESALQVVTECRAGYRAERAAALKKWQDESGYFFAALYFPRFIYKLVSRQRTDDALSPVKWEIREVPGEPWPLPNRLGTVPVVPLWNRPRLLIEGMSEIADVIPIQDAVNKLLMDMLVASEYAGFAQRTISGIEIPTDPETGQPLKEMWKQALESFLTSPNPETRFGTLEASDLGNYVKAIELAVQHIASRTRTPPHYFYLSGQFPSGESLRAAEAGLVAKARRKMRHFGESWEEVIRLAFLAAGDTAKAERALSAETIWADPETHAFAELMDGLIKQQAIGVPDEILWERAGYSAQEIKRIKEIRQALPAPPAPTTQAPGNGQIVGTGG